MQIPVVDLIIRSRQTTG